MTLARYVLGSIGIPVLSLIFGSGLWLECLGKERTSFEVRGAVSRSNDIPSPGAGIFVQITGPYGPPHLNAVADSKGRFRFKKVPMGIYLLTAFIPRVARVRRTVEVGPSFADEEGRIEFSLKLEPRPRRMDRFLVPAEQLSIPEKARSEYDKGRQRMADADLAGAIACFEKALDIAPQFAAAWYQLGLVAGHQHHLAEAVSHFRKALEHYPGNFQTILRLGMTLMAMQNGPEAIEVNGQAVGARPEDAEAQAQLGYSYLLADRLQEAEKHLKIAIDLDPASFHFPQLMLAEIYRRREDYPSMERELESFLRLHPDSPTAPEIVQRLSKVRDRAKIGR